MNEMEKVAEWVEYKIGRLLTEDVEKKILSEDSSFDIDKYSEAMFEKHFANAPEINHLKCEINYKDLKLKLHSDDFCLTDGFSQDSSDDDFHPPSLENIILDLQSPSEQAKIRALESLEACSAEEMVMHSSWTRARKLLQDLIKKPKSQRVSNQILELFRRFLLSKDTPKVVCEGFVSLAESISFGIEAYNFQRSNELTPEIYDFKASNWLNTSLVSLKGNDQRKRNVEMIFKSMWLLVQSQKGIPYKWARFNEKRLREIIFSFIHMLSETENLKNSDCLCGLEILAVLDPRATWCINWCHGATGRLLLCSALKTHKKLFIEIVDFILVRIKIKQTPKLEIKTKSNSNIKLPSLKGSDNLKFRSKSENLNLFDKDSSKNMIKTRNKYSARLSVRDQITSTGNHSAPPYPANENKNHSFEKIYSDWIVKGISRDVVSEALFCHCLSMVVYLVQYRSGRSLFPMEVASRRRRITIPDFIITVLNYINSIIFYSEGNILTTDEYKHHMLKLIEILKTLTN